MHATSIDSWSFRLGDDPHGWKKAADESAYRPVRVPHDWAVELPFDPHCSSGTGYLPGGTGWYRAHCSVAALGLVDAGVVRLVFHGVYKHAQVWVNGYHLGRRASGHAEFWFDLTEIVGYAPDDDLVVSVRVDHRDLADSRWYNGTGLTRQVQIEVHDPVTLARHGTTLTTVAADAAAAEVALVQRLENHSADDRRVTVEHTLELLGSTAEPVHRGTHTVDVPAGGSATLSSSMVLTDPALWSDDQPHLHRLLTTITDGPRSGRHRLVVGLRTFAFDPDTGLTVNGRRRLLRGVCLHEDAGPLGVAVPPEVWLRRLLTLRSAGCNAVRMAHNPHAPELYALCDLLGLYVIDEAFDEWENPKNKWWQGHNVYPPKLEGYAHDYPEWHARDLAAMVEAHRHHPSVIAWSIGNEVDYPNDPYASALFEQMTGNNDALKPAAERRYDPNRPDVRRLTTLAGELVAIVKAHDLTRPVTLAAAFPELSSRTGLLDRLDLVGYNYKEHLYVEDHARFPHQPLVGSENGHSYGAWRAVVDHEFVAGQFLWTGIDYLGETPGWPSHGSAAGLLTTAGFAKERWHLRRSWWTDDAVLRLAVRPAADPADAAGTSDRHRPFGRDWHPGGALDVACVVADKAQAVTVTSGGREVALTFDADLGFWRGTLDQAADELVATASLGGVELRDRLVPRGVPVGLTAQVWAVPTRYADGLAWIRGAQPPVHQVECRLVDERGAPARGDVVVGVEVRDGQLLGLDNGDLSDTTPYAAAERATHDGRLIVYVRGDGATVHVRALGLGETIVTTPRLREEPTRT